MPSQDPASGGSTRNLCIGRESLAKETIRAVQGNGSVLLFGSRRTGKTTFLAYLATALRPPVNDTCQMDVPIYVDLMGLGVDAGPPDFFQYVFAAARGACQQIMPSISDVSVSAASASPREPFGAFIHDLRKLQECFGPIQVRFIFLLDESKRILSDRFPRGLQDNLFSMMYGGEETVEPRIGIVFCGSQELLALSVDDTSPIGSRAARICITGLSIDALAELGSMLLPDLARDMMPRLAEIIHQRTGGHAGLSKRFYERLRDVPGRDSADVDQVARELQRESAELFRLTLLKMTAECAALMPTLHERKRLRLAEAVHELHHQKLNRFAAQRVFEEMTFSGVGIGTEQEIVTANELFWNYYDQFAIEESSTWSSAGLWQLIRETELQLRGLVRAKFVKQWGVAAEASMRRILGEDSWRKIEENKAKSDRQYPLAVDRTSRDLMSCMYLGQMMQLMVSGASWAEFKHLFRDKRQLEDLMAAIVPVRNDEAHFSQVPAKEAQRCQVACGDLLVIAERELQRMKTDGAS